MVTKQKNTDIGHGRKEKENDHIDRVPMTITGNIK